jgi:two-component system, NarL family, invasion response regulator UvrY
VIRILIADDHAVVRRGLIQILLEGFPEALFGEASNAREVLQKIGEEKWNLLTLDISMPDRSGIDLLRELQANYPKLPVLVLSMHPEEQYARRVLKSGASGYLSKDSAPLELTNAVRKLLKGGRYVSPTVAESLLMDLATEEQRSRHENLSNREMEVLRMMASGKTTTQIADTLCLSPKTISTYRARMLEKLEMTTTADLIRYAIENQILN